MKFEKLMVLVFILHLVACASSAPTNPNQCIVKLDQGLLADSVEITNGVAFKGYGCITGKFGCKYKEAKYVGSDIYIEGPLTQDTGKVASYKNGVFDYDFQGLNLSSENLKGGLKLESQPSKVILHIDGNAGRAKAATLIRSTNKTNVQTDWTFNYSGTCSKSDQALGVAYFMSGSK